VTGDAALPGADNRDGPRREVPSGVGRGDRLAKSNGDGFDPDASLCLMNCLNAMSHRRLENQPARGTIVALFPTGLAGINQFSEIQVRR